MKGSMLDLAIGLILGAAFGSVVTSLVNDVIMPPIGLLLGHVDFKALFLALNGQSYASLDDAKKASAPVLAYGVFLNTIINFVIIAFVAFLIVKQANRLKKPAPAAAPTTKECPECASMIPLKARRCPNCTAPIAPLTQGAV